MINSYDKQKASEYDQEMPHSHNTDSPTHREEETQNTKSHMTSKEMQLKMVTVFMDKSHTLAFSLHVVSLLQYFYKSSFKCVY